MPSRSQIERIARATYRRLPPSVAPRAAEAFLRVRALGDAYRSPNALLSVVMPVYNVEGYLTEAVESVLSQSYRNLELILVDDGSTDTSGALCDAFAAQDRRVRVIHKENGGLGAARNTGIEAARGVYLAFVDSDDIVLPGAYSTMLASLRRTGSDLVTGNVQRKQGTRLFQAWNQSRSHLTDKRSVTLKDEPELLFDTVAWNKIYRKDFWDRHPKAFPVRKLYEDMVPVFTAFVNARSIDVVAKPVYVWRLRDEGDSITQRLMEPENITDRFEMLDQIRDLIAGHGFGPVLTERFALKILEGDLWIYVREMAGVDEQVVRLIEERTRRYWTDAPAASKAAIPTERRICYWLLENGRGAEVESFREWYSEAWSVPPLVRDAAKLRLDTATCPVSLDGIPDAYLDLTLATGGVTDITRIWWDGPTLVRVDGYAYIHHVSRGDQDIELVATERGTGATVVFPVERTDTRLAARWSNDKHYAHDRDDFTCPVDVAALAARSTPGDEKRVWEFSARIRDEEIERTVSLTRIWRGGASAAVKPVVLDDRTVVAVGTDPRQPLRLVIDRSGVVASSFEVVDDRVTVAFDGRADVRSVWAVRVTPRLHVAAHRAGGGAWSVRLPATPDPAEIVTWRVHAHADGIDRRVYAPAGFVDPLAPNPAGLRPLVEVSGSVAVHAYRSEAVVDRVTVGEDATIEVSGIGYGTAAGGLEFGLAPNNGEASAWYPADLAAGRFTVRIPTVRPDLWGVPRPIKSGGYQLVARVPGGNSGDVGVALHEPALVSLPSITETPQAKVKVSRAWPARVSLDIAAPIPEQDLGRYVQTRLIESYATGERVLEDAVFFCVDLGANAGDSALAIHEELRRRGTDLRLYWGVQDLSVPVPEGGVPVLKLSRDWYEKLNTSRYIVNNYGGVWGLTKPPDQRYLQTWHGTPLKYVGASEQRHRKGSDVSLDKLAAEAGEWDAFVSPSPYLSELVPSEFLFSGPLLETGYPRNDRLVTAAPEERAALRRLLGLPDSARVVLYAPTFRDTNRNGWAAATFGGLDLARLLELLGPDWHVLLRGHSFNARYDRSDHSSGRIHDVTHHPDINDLYLASDVLVTDYSSTMFDYAVTGKPMLFFTPDLELYVASRGMYFDLAEAAPAPLDIDVVTLAGHLQDVETVQAENADRYAAFKARFAPWDDGKAAARVVDAFFG